jgi:type I restriction enzyme M protein
VALQKGCPLSGQSMQDLTTLQTRTFYGKENESLADVIAIMSKILHGIEALNIIHIGRPVSSLNMHR